jgi:hypothetical protein
VNQKICKKIRVLTKGDKKAYNRAKKQYAKLKSPAKEDFLKLLEEFYNN